jgi:shikimate dehydrogenase
MPKGEENNRYGMVLALFGNPVGQSLSPRMHNRALQLMGIKGHYVPFLVDDLPEAVRAIRGLRIHGVSVTIPFKEQVIPFLNEIDDDARKIGSVNTILNEGQKLTGFNTDWKGVEASLKKKIRIRGSQFVLIGSGGTTRAAVYAVLKNGGDAVIVSRNREKGQALANEFGCRWGSEADILKNRGDCLINTTPLGMVPEIERMPVTEETVKHFPLVMDAVYNPPETRLLKVAREAGGMTISGVEMFVAQGAEQLRIWTGMEPPQRSMKAVVLAAFREQTR